MPDIIHAVGSDLMRYGLFGATTYDTKKWTGYGAAFGLQTCLHKDGKNARNLVILGVDLNDSKNAKTKENNALVLGKSSVQISDTATVQTEDELKTNCTITN